MQHGHQTSLSTSDTVAAEAADTISEWCCVSSVLLRAANSLRCCCTIIYAHGFDSGDGLTFAILAKRATWPMLCPIGTPAGKEVPAVAAAAVPAVAASGRRGWRWRLLLGSRL
jgi:hypothetical protein